MPTNPTTVKWPFLMGDAFLVGLAVLLFGRSDLPLNGPALAACVTCVSIGAVLGVIPFIMDYSAASRLAESNGLTDTMAQIRNLESVAANVTDATAKWQRIHEHAEAAVQSARDISEKMSAEASSFLGFLEKAADSERRHLALEVDKLKRAESEWLGVLVRILDHVFAIHAAARTAGQNKVADQLDQLQSACRDAARRVGLTPYEVEPGSAFDPVRHRLPGGRSAENGVRIVETLASGISFQGQLIRPALVRVEPQEELSAKDPQDGRTEPPAGTGLAQAGPQREELPI